MKLTRQLGAMALAGAAAFIFFALVCFGRALTVHGEAGFDIAGGVKFACICLGVLIGCGAAMAGAVLADD